MKADMRPLVFLHGWGFNPGIWSEFIGQHFQSVPTQTPDLSISASSCNGQSHRSLKKIAYNLMHQIDADNINLLGWSLGGQLAIECAHQFPDKIASLLLVACNPCFVKKPDWPYGPEEASIKKMQQSLYSKRESVKSHFTGLLAKGLLNAQEKQQRLEALFSSAGADALAAGLDLLIYEDQRTALGDLDLPVHCLYGKKDRLLKSELSSRIKNCNSSVDVTLFNDSGHVPFLFESNETAAWIKARLGQA